MNVLKVFNVSLGCPKNRVDTELFIGSLGAVAPVAEPSDADLIFINTCGFIQPAVEESLRTILENAEAAAGAGTRPLLVAAGCMVSRYGAEELSGELDEVDLWLPLDRQEDWPQMVLAALGREHAGVRGRACSTGPSYAYLKVSEGCGHNCAFCTIPSIRGPLKSYPKQRLVDEARMLVDGGVKELVLVAQDVTSYGRGPGADAGLEELLADLCAIDGLEWLRPMYLYPAGLTEERLKFLAGLGRPFIPYFDIPMQHAHPEILSAMGRPFARDPRVVIDRVRRHFPEAALRTSIITGFPGETDEHFEALMRFVGETRFAQLGVFAYQPEDGTPAAEMPGQVPEEVREERRERLMELQAEISEEMLEEFPGRQIEVLVDAESPEWPGLHVGRTWFQAPEVDGVVYISGPDVKPGSLMRAEVVESKTYDLVALS